MLRGGADPARFARTMRRLEDARLIRIDRGRASISDVDTPSDAMSPDGVVEPADGADQENSIAALADNALRVEWPALQDWIRTDGSTEQRRRRLESEAARWRQCERQGLPDLGLLDKAQLSELATWLPARAPDDARPDP